MSFMIFLQIFVNVAMVVALAVVFARLRRPAKDDPRLSKGLQLLSSKIAVLEDLSDRTETQVQQMLLLLDQKSRELQSKIALADQQVAAVRQSMEQSLEVAQIFQDKIPHSEIIERQNSVKYIRAARLAHAGASVADIAREVDLPTGEIEFIAKVNQENLSFREEDLPAWAKEPVAASTFQNTNTDALARAQTLPAESVAAATPMSQDQENLVHRLSRLQFEMKNLDLELAHRTSRNVMPDTTQAFGQQRLDSSSLERLGEEFRRAVEDAERTEQAAETKPVTQPASPVPITAHVAPQHSADILKPDDRALRNESIARNVSIPELEAARAAAAALRNHDRPAASAAPSAAKTIRRVEFPRI